MATEKKETKKTAEDPSKKRGRPRKAVAPETIQEPEKIIDESAPEIITEMTEPAEDTAPEIIEKPEEPKTYTVRTSSKLRVRKGPGFDFEIIRHLKNGAKVTALEKIDSWARIGENEWVCMDYLK